MTRTAASRAARQRRDACVIVLAAAGAIVDAAVYLSLHTFVANMTGNTVLLGLGLGGMKWEDALRAGIAIGAFFAGTYLGATVGREANERDPWPARISVVLLLDAAVIAACALLWPLHLARSVILIACAAIAMGMQSAATRDLDGGSVSSTFLSGTLMRIAFSVHRLTRGGDPGELGLNLRIWIVYVFVAVAAGFAGLRMPAAIPALIWLSAALIALVGSGGRRFAR